MIGFVILSHNNPQQLRRLITTLNVVYDQPPIACHHDFNQTILDRRHYSSNVRFVDDYVSTGWGRWSLVVGFLRALRLLYATSSPDWFIFLSAADYPIKTAQKVREELKQLTADALLDLRPVIGSTPERHYGTPDPALAHHDNLVIATTRYVHGRIAILPNLRNALDEKRHSSDFPAPPKRTIRVPFKSALSPFTEDLHCFVGSQWFSARQRVADLLLNPTPEQIKLRKFYSYRWVADESFVHTIIGNDPTILVDRNPRRLTKWTCRAAHPISIQLDDIDLVKDSTGHFARKFTGSSDVLDYIDRHILHIS